MYLEKDNPVRELRNRLKLSQVEFSGLIGRSLQSVRAYEKHPEDLTPEVMNRLCTIATDHGYADLAASFAPGKPPAEQPAARVRPAAKPKPAGASRHQRWHDMLEAVLESGKPTAIRAVQSNLVVFTDYVEPKDPESKAVPFPQKKSGS